MPRPRKRRRSTRSANLVQSTAATETAAHPGYPSLRAYIGALPPPSFLRFAARANVNPEYLKQLAHGWAKANPSVALAVRIERASWGVIRCEELLPEAPWQYLRWRPAPGEEYRNDEAQAIAINGSAIVL